MSISPIAATMQLQHLTLQNFRNYARGDVRLRSQTVVFHGANGAGKTSLLEAICLAATGYSPRAREMGEMVRTGGDHAFVRAHFRRAEGAEATLETGLARNGTRQIKVNGVVRRRADLIGVAPVVYFSADDLGVIKGEPSARRRLIDRELSAISRTYYFHWQRYQRAIEQRNRLLKDLRARRRGGDGLEPWDRSAARYGARVMLERHAFIQLLARESERAHAVLTGGARRLFVEYLPAVALPNGQSGGDWEKDRDALAEELTSSLTAALRARREGDIAQGVTGCGPHRDDLGLRLGEQALREFGSQGEQRACAASIRIGLASTVEHITGASPVVLLDDVLSELDARYREGVFAASQQAEQVIVTSCDLADIPAGVRGESQIFEVVDGRVA